MAGGISFLRCKPCFVLSDNVDVIWTLPPRSNALTPPSTNTDRRPSRRASFSLAFMNEVRSDLGSNAFNELVAEFDLELLYGIAPLESDD